MHYPFQGLAAQGRNKIYIIVWTLGTLVVAMAGPFGTFESYTFPQRLLFWGVVVITSTLLGAFLRSLTMRLVPEDRPWRRDGLQVLLMTLVFAPFVWLTEWLMLQRPAASGPHLGRVMFYVAIVSVGICVMRRVVRQSFAQAGEAPGPAAPESAPAAEASEGAPVVASEADPAPAEQAPEPVPQPPRLIRRLPEPMAGRIIRLNVKDHQVRVITTEGEYSIRLRFGDAIDEMDPVDGFCTHRSHWVARHAVSGAEKERGKTYLRLVNGDRVPVSRTYLSDLEDAGLL